VVDVKACDDQGRSYQIEIQLAVHPGLSERMLYTWSTIYHSLIGKGDEFIKLRPVGAIWLLNESLFPDRQAWHLSFAVMDRNHGVTLSDHLQIHLLQLPDWQVSEDVHEELDRWMYLFKEGVDLDVEALPAILETEEMRQAIQVLQHFSENERAYLMYQQRLESEMVQASWQNEIQRATARAEQATRQAERERQKKEKLLALLKQAGIDPTSRQDE
jgi:predicted transposase/invertase (TIGR01784 family)